MKIWLDDERSAPRGWVRTRTVNETISRLNMGNVTHLSLDHDLGTEATGYDVLLWIERETFVNGFKSPRITVHSANPVGRQRMQAAIEKIARINGEFSP